MAKIEIIKDCFCEHYLHEITKYPRPGLKEKKFQKGQILTLQDKWTNYFGTYFKCKHEDGTVDIDVNNAKIIEEGVDEV